MSIEVRGLTKVFETGRRRSQRRDRGGARHLASASSRASASPTSGRTAPGSRRRSRSSPGSCTRPAARRPCSASCRGTTGAGSPARIGTLFGQRSLLWFELTPRQSYRMLAAIYGLDRQREHAPHRRAGRAARGRRPVRPARPQPVARPAHAVRARRVHAARPRGPVPRRADHRSRPRGQAAVPRAARAAQRPSAARRSSSPHTTSPTSSTSPARAIVINHGSVIYDDEVAAMRRALLATKLVEVGLRPARRDRSCWTASRCSSTPTRR